MDNSVLDEIESTEKKADKHIEQAKENAEKMIDNSRKGAVEYINDITDKAQAFTAKKIEEAENKAEEIFDETRASAKSTARMINNIADKKSGEIKDALDSILFD